jgi:hypothetical protein
MPLSGWTLDGTIWSRALALASLSATLRAVEVDFLAEEVDACAGRRAALAFKTVSGSTALALSCSRGAGAVFNIALSMNAGPLLW